MHTMYHSTCQHVFNMRTEAIKLYLLHNESHKTFICAAQVTNDYRI